MLVLGGPFTQSARVCRRRKCGQGHRGGECPVMRTETVGTRISQGLPTTIRTWRGKEGSPFPRASGVGRPRDTVISDPQPPEQGDHKSLLLQGPRRAVLCRGGLSNEGGSIPAPTSPA